MPQMTEVYEWQGRTVVGEDGEKIGTIKDIYARPGVEWCGRQGTRCDQDHRWSKRDLRRRDDAL